MIIYEDDCVCCDLPCISCGRKHTPHFYCDECGEEGKLYRVGDKEYCEKHALESLDVVEGSDCY